MIQSKEFPTLFTNRLKLRAFDLSDGKEVQRLAGNPKIADTTATIPHPYPDGAAEDWISKHSIWFEKNLAIIWAIELLTHKKLIGCINLSLNNTHFKAELGYWIGEEFWNNGFCSEAAKSVVEYAFNALNLNKITSRHMVSNPSSGRVMEKIGMEKEGLLKKDFYKNGIFVDKVVFGLLKQDFK